MKLSITIILILSAFRVLAGTPSIEVVGTDTVDFGEYQAIEKKVAVYKIKNSGTADLEIIKLRKTCGCASATAEKMKLEPDEETDVKVVILPNTIFGLFGKNTFVESNDPNNRFLRLNAAGKAIPLVAVTPDMSLHAGRIKPNTKWSQTFSLTPSQDRVRMGDIKLESNFPIEGTLTAISNSPNYQLHVEMPPTDESGDLKCEISVPVLSPTNHPPLKISITGRLGYELNAVPGIAYLPVSETPIIRKFQLKVLGQRSRVLKQDEIMLPDNEEITFAAEKAKHGNGLVVTATFSPDFTKQLFAEKKIPIRFTVPGVSSATVVCKSKE